MDSDQVKELDDAGRIDGNFAAVMAAVAVAEIDEGDRELILIQGPERNSRQFFEPRTRRRNRDFVDTRAMPPRSTGNGGSFLGLVVLAHAADPDVAETDPVIVVLEHQ